MKGDQHLVIGYLVHSWIFDWEKVLFPTSLNFVEDNLLILDLLNPTLEITIFLWWVITLSYVPLLTKF